MSFPSLLAGPGSYARVPAAASDWPSEALDTELDAAFDEPVSEASERTDEDAPLVLPGSRLGEGSSRTAPVPLSVPAPGAYDFEHDPPPVVRLQGMGGGVQNDGVFANLSAKPSGRRPTARGGEMEIVGGADEAGGTDKAETLPTYDAAALDAAPPYWETTVTLPGGAGAYGMLGPDDVLVDGLAVGNLFGFAWNLLVSMSFQFIGFLLTYLLHTTHAAKNGSRAGLGITLIQYGLYTRTRAAELAGMADHGRTNDTALPTTTDPWGLFGPASRNDWDGSSAVPKGAQGMPYDGNPSGSPGDPGHVSGVANEWLSYMLIAAGWFLLLGGMVNYWRAVRWARAVRCEEMVVGSLA